MNIQNIVQVMATFFVNELSVNLMPDIKERTDFIMAYRVNIDMYCTSTTAVLNQHNPSYELLRKKLLRFIYTYIPSTDEEFVNFLCSNICPPSIISQYKYDSRNQLLRRFITDCIKLLTTYMLAQSSEYINVFFTRNKTNIGTFRQNLLNNFATIINKIISDLYIECINSDKDINHQVLVNIDENSKVISELRHQNEDLQFNILRLKEENAKLKQRIVMLEVKVEKDDDEEEDEDI